MYVTERRKRKTTEKEDAWDVSILCWPSVVVKIENS